MDPSKNKNELSLANQRLAFENEEKEKRAQELIIANKELANQNKEKEKLAEELVIANKELAYQNKEKEKRADELAIANKKLAFENIEKEKRADELAIANKELAYQNKEKEKRADELAIANKKLAFENNEKENRAGELSIANNELAYQNIEKEKRADELFIANKELASENEEKEKRGSELIIANKELAYQIEEKEKRAAELVIANRKLAIQNKDIEKKASDLIIVNKELAYQIEEKEKKAAELGIANRKLAIQNKEIEKRASELIVSNKELAYQIEEKEKRAAELAIAIRKLAHQNKEIEKKAAELIVANKELAHQNEVKEKLSSDLLIINKELTDYKSAIDQVSIVAITDIRGIIRYANDNFCKISKYSLKEIIGSNYRIINSEYQSNEFFEILWATISKGKIWKGEIKNRAKDGIIYWQETTIIPFLNEQGKPYQYVALQFDITERKKAEDKLKEQLQGLKTQNTQLTDFNYIISHNLRGQVVNIGLLLQFIEGSSDAAEKEDLFGKMKQVVETINETFNELVESLQIKYDPDVESKPLIVKDILNKTLKILEFEISSSGAKIELNTDKAPVIDIPKKYLESILFNLISNSLKFKSPDRKPVIKIKTTKTDHHVVLSVADNGLGIDLKMHQHNMFKIRKVFHKHPDAKGFGLFMTKTQVETMGGKIWVESTPDVGSTFFVEFVNQNI